MLIAPASASPNPAAPLAAAAPLSAMEANWAYSNGNQFNQDYNPQNQINSSNAQNLGLAWLFPLPTHPTALLNVAGGLGVDTAPLIINGTVYAVTQFGQAFALNAANGNVIWTDVLPLLPNSTAGIKGAGNVSLHLHNANEQFTTKLFGNTPTWWIAAGDYKVYALNALNGKYELNFSIFQGVNTVDGNNPGSLDSAGKGILVDQNRGVLISSDSSGSSPATGRCFYRGWNVLVTPPPLLWTTFCTPPQPGGNLATDPNWTINQVNGMKGAQIFYPGPQFNNGGYIPNTNGQAVVDLKKLSAAQLNSTLYDDWGYVNQSPDCKAYTSGSSTGSTAAGWGAPWLLGVGPTAGLAFVNTNNRDPYTSPCMPGPDLWSASVLALNETNGNWVWGFQAAAHEPWDYDCSWWQGMGNETVGGVSTQVVWKTCKNGYLYELNSQTGNLIWAWTPAASVVPRCQYCYMLNPLNSTQMTIPYFNPGAIGKGQGTLMFPSEYGAFENEAAYSPALNYLFLPSHNVPLLAYYVAPNSTNYRTNSGIAFFPPAGATALSNTGDNSTISALNAGTGQVAWSYFIPSQGFRGGVTVSGNVLYAALSSGDLVMLNAKTGALIKDYFIGGPLNVLTSVGATASGQVELILPITAGLVSWATGVPGDIVALTLQPGAGGGTTTVTSSITSTATSTAVSTTTAVSTSITTVTATSSGGVSSTVLYGVAAVAVIFIIATGYFAMRGRKPAS